jgi:SNF2 family DNA or RNA helicase
VSGVVVTSYGVIRRDTDVVAAVDWDVVTLDEAQHVKNPTTAGAKAVRRLRAEQVVVLTGTPLENRLGELWSLLDVTNRGLLGTRGRFGRRYVAPIERRRDPAAAARLRRVVAPFILRREKTDPNVVSDLPPKIERTVACSLTPEQAALYQAAVDRVLGGDGLAAASSMERRGKVLALLTELKQICNHPAQALRERDPGAARTDELVGRSGKLAAAREIIREATAAGDQVLVFTQYVEMGKLLVRQLGSDLGVDVPFLHGGVGAGARDAMVAAFQGDSDAAVPPVLIVSLRAGGTGLNLTAATHVLHYDRWWNPAVEDQATDRAHRIGQHRSVEVHKLVTAGTVEERVADLLERKRALADTVVGAGEQWITELGEDDLRELVALSASAEELEEDPFDDDAWEPRGPDGAGLLEEAAAG